MEATTAMANEGRAEPEIPTDEEGRPLEGTYHYVDEEEREHVVTIEHVYTEAGERQCIRKTDKGGKLTITSSSIAARQPP
jgi:hypothetical protein